MRRGFWLTAVVIALPLLALLASNYALLFTTPQVSRISLPALTMLYRDHYGTYQMAGTFIVDIYQAAARHNIRCREYLGQFFHTFAVPEGQRYARYGCVVDALPAIVPEGFSVATIPAQDYIMLVRKEQGPLVNQVMDNHLQDYAAQHNLALADYFIELYTPPRVPRGTAEMLRPLQGTAR